MTTHGSIAALSRADGVTARRNRSSVSSSVLRQLRIKRSLRHGVGFLQQAVNAYTGIQRIALIALSANTATVRCLIS